MRDWEYLVINRTESVPAEGMQEGMEESVAREEGESDQPKKEESEGMKQMKKGASAIGGFFKKGWGAVKSGAQKANEKFKETEVVQRGER